MSARFIVLEGGDGSGKTTQVALLSDWLDELGVEHVATREPGGTPLGEAVRSVVLGRTDLDVPAASELFLYLASRAAFVRDVVRPALAAGKVVVSDRFDLSTLAYQGYGRGLPVEEVRRAIALATGGLRPDVTLLLDVEVEEGVARRRAGGNRAGRFDLLHEPDRIEREGDVFLRRVREGYLALAADDERVRVLSGLGSPTQVQERVRAALTGLFPETFARGTV